MSGSTWVRHWAGLWLEWLLKWWEMIFLGFFFIHVIVYAEIYWESRQDMAGSMKMWLPRKSNQTRKGHDRHVWPSFDGVFYVCRFEVLIYKGVDIMSRQINMIFTTLSCLTFAFIIYNDEIWYVPLKRDLFMAIGLQVWWQAAGTRRWGQKRNETQL